MAEKVPSTRRHPARRARRPVLRSVALASLALCSLFATGLLLAPWGLSQEATPEQLARGLELYRQNYCGFCHQLDAIGSTGIFGPPHNAIGIIAGARVADPHYAGSATTAEGYLRESILHPEAYLVPGYALSRHRMPAYVQLSEEDVDALVQFLLSQQ